ncbi:DUF6578 domain-containing protein [Amnibacterium flavum]|uniref:Uncharacterized protein n=1 Tax=Amnibacterium flavum TaxID=2173173 RepID=A0A2V1HPD1_9MICO|nr:DUF6578 domain-containing protein [Amnibacterium flavum]PVZ94385.1 hypothetical protein DDQ50_11750 [Amnibacterium flavum]
MLIEVKVAGWEQRCCGEAFAVGGVGSWNVIADDPAQTVHLSTFHTEQHGQAEPEVPNWSVEGTIRAIDGLVGQHARVPGRPGMLVWAEDRSKSYPMESVTAEGEDDDQYYDTYLVTLEVPDDFLLPDYVESEWSIRRREAEAARRARSRAAMTDEVGRELEALADQAQTRFARAADILRDTDSSAISFRPHAQYTADLHWARVDDQGPDLIQVEVADGSWTIPASLESVAELRGVLESASAGRVEERFEGRPVLGLITTVTIRDFRSDVDRGSDLKAGGRERKWVSTPGSMDSRKTSGVRIFRPWS